MNASGLYAREDSGPNSSFRISKSSELPISSLSSYRGGTTIRALDTEDESDDTVDGSIGPSALTAWPFKIFNDIANILQDK